MHYSRQPQHQQRERPRSAAPSPPPKRSKVPGSGFQRRDWQGRSGFQIQDRQVDSGFQSQDRQGESGFQRQDRQGESGFQRQDRQGESGFQRRDRQGESGFQRRDRSRQGRSGRGIDVQLAKGKSSSYSSSELFDAEYISEHYPPIDREMYKSAPNSLWEDPRSFLWDSKGINARSSFIVARVGYYRCNLVLSFPNGRKKVDAIGDGMDKREAEENACLHAVHKLHETGLLKDIAIPLTAYDPSLIKEEHDAIMDIYDYCARFDTVPTFEVKEIRSRGRAIVEFIVNMPQQNIRAMARAKERKTAEVLASVEFKRQAEKWHAENGDEDLIVKDASALNSRNARRFFEYYKMRKRGADYGPNFSIPRGPKKLTGSTTLAQMYLNGAPIGEAVEMQGKKNAETGCYLTGAVALKSQQPELFEGFVEALRQGNGELLKPLQPSFLNIDQDCILAMTDTILKCRKVGMETDRVINEVGDDVRRIPYRRDFPQQFNERKNLELQEALNSYLGNPKLEELRKKKFDLPMNLYREQVLQTVNKSPVSIIVGATGSGKTTQVPQILFDEAIKAGKGSECNIICTQPRRIAATSVAQRVAVERNEPLQKTVGYHVRFDAKQPQPGGSIIYCTTGILLQQLRNHPEEALSSVSHLIIDEVHERDILIDLLLVILKRVMATRMKKRLPEIKIILMSATMDTELFAGYFKQMGPGGQKVACPSLSVPGRTFPVKEKYLDQILEELQKFYTTAELKSLLNEKDTKPYLEVEQKFVPVTRPTSAVDSVKDENDDDGGDAVINWKTETAFNADGQAAVSSEKDDALVPTGLIAATIAHIARTSTEGAILVFLPGLQEITSIDEFVRTQRPLGVNFNDTSKFRISMLHSSIPTVQNEIFGEVPRGCRKIIFSTNIAETSVTIPDVQYVVDTGKMREKQYEQQRRITQLVCTWVSKSNSKQRAGRAGRVQNGNYYALFTNKRLESMRAAGLPEMLRSDLQEICLDIKAQGFTDPVAQFLSEAIEPPTPAAVEASMQQLRMLQALDEAERLTPLGRVLATLPVEPALGKMILLGVIFRCLDPMLILGALSSTREIFIAPLNARKEAERAKATFTRGTASDHLAYLNAFREWREIRDRQGQFAAHRFSEENYLHRGALKTVDQTACQIEDILVESRLIPYTKSSDRFRSELGHPSLNDNASSVPLIKALTLSGMYPNLAICSGGRGFRTANENFTMIHPNSVNYVRKTEDLMPFGTAVTFSTKAKSNDGTSILLRAVTEVTTLSATLFGGKLSNVGNMIEIDNWVPINAHQPTLKVTWEFRKCLDRLLHTAFQDLARSGRNRSNFLADHPARETFARGLVEVLDRDVKRREKAEREKPPENRLQGTGRPGGSGNVSWSSRR
ncbi:P-loop containing nucleoside triphosphate hydrolase protein [Terfezia boudieri ATCC MYA-4762]|uniref:RNA helicase n=1 Tax=Terfezia boudieri ATCC MYA-4762 TaxID=1051890 RepID=A0A3N4LGZ8_9PEZI|nr:P-loop containing nucleoside triphosphate hydrolase protein [Terfezia boudieri ATCC MYA-4762]